MPMFTPARYGWITIPFKTNTPFIETTAKCDIELVLLHCWSFSEVLKIRCPWLPIKAPKQPTNTMTSIADEASNAHTEHKSNTNQGTPRKRNVTPGNVSDVLVLGKKLPSGMYTLRASVTLQTKQTKTSHPPALLQPDATDLNTRPSYTMRAQPPPKKVTHRTSGRKRMPVNYTQYDISDAPSSPPKKCKKVDLKRKPKSRIAAEKYKTKPLGGL